MPHEEIREFPAVLPARIDEILDCPFPVKAHELEGIGAAMI